MAFTWAEITVPTSSGDDVLDFAWDSGHSLLCGVGSNGLVYTTPDLVTVTKRTASSASRWNAVAYAPTLGTAGRLVAVGSSPGDVMTSDDGGVTWTDRTPAAGNAWRGVVWAASLSLFVAVSDTGTGADRVMTSPDGITWTIRTGAVSGAPWKGITWSGSLLVAAALDATATSTIVMTSTDGISWTGRSTPANYYMANGLVTSGSNFILWDSVSSLFAAAARNTGDSNRYVLTSPDGITWTPQTIPDAADTTGAFLSVPSIGLVLFRSNTGAEKVNTSANGTTWATESTGNVTARSNNAAGIIPTLSKICSWCSGSNTVMTVGTYTPPATPTRVIPSRGRTSGGRLVRITGTNFSGTPVVTFSGTPATDVLVMSATLLTARTPAHVAGLVSVVVDGVTLSDAYLYTDSLFGDLTIRREQGIIVDDTLNDAPNTAQMRCERVGSPESPSLGASVLLEDPASGAVLIGGTALVVTDGIDGRPENPGYRDLDVGDLTWRLNAIRPYGTFVDASATAVAEYLIDTFAPQFGAVIEQGLPLISLTCDRSQTLSQILSTIAALVGGAWYPDDEFVVHLFLTNTSVDPDPITDATALYDPPPTITRDLTQVRNRVYVSGAGGATSYEEPVNIPLSALGPGSSWTNFITPATGGSIPQGLYGYFMSYTTEFGETYPTPLFADPAIVTMTAPNNAFQLDGLDQSVHPDPRVTGRRLWRTKSALNASETAEFRSAYLVTTFGNTAGGADDSFLDTLPDAALIVKPPTTNTTGSVFVMVEDVAAQAYLAALLNVDGGTDDGVRESFISDPSLTTNDQAAARGNAELTLWANPIETVTVAARDEKLVSGKEVSITLTNPAVAGTFKIQHVRIDQIAVDAAGFLFARRTITASSVRFTLDDLLRGVVLPGSTGGAGVGSSSSASGGASGGATSAATVYVEELTDQIGGSPSGVFTTTQAFSQIEVHKNGLQWREPDDYTVTGANQITAVIAPVAGDSLTVEYR